MKTRIERVGEDEPSFDLKLDNLVIFEKEYFNSDEPIVGTVKKIEVQDINSEIGKDENDPEITVIALAQSKFAFLELNKPQNNTRSLVIGCRMIEDEIKKGRIRVI